MKNNRRGIDQQLNLNRYQAQGIRQTINFDDDKNLSNHNDRKWRRKQRLNTTLSSTMTNYPNNLTTASPMTESINLMSIDVTKAHENFADIENWKKKQQEFKQKTQENKINSSYQTEQNNATNRMGFQTNEIPKNLVTTTLSPKEIKMKRLKKIRHQLNRLSPDQQNEFFKRRARAQRNKKRGLSSGFYTGKPYLQKK